MTKDEALKLAMDWFCCYLDKSMSRNNGETLAEETVTAIKAALLSRSDGEAKDEKQKPVNIKKVAEEHGINLPTEFVPKHDESKAAIQSLTDQCAALIWERDELQKQMWRSEKQEPVTWRYKIVDVFGRPVWTLKTPKSDTRVLESQPLYTTPPQRPSRSDIKPLTDEELFKLWVRVPAETEDRFAFARAIEAAHGIKE